jgi:hypothetical protein
LGGGLVNLTGHGKVVPCPFLNLLMINFEIRRVYSYKGKTFCMSAVNGNAFWSVHNSVMNIQQAKNHAQRAHNQQILSLVQEKLREDAKNKSLIIT